MTFEHPANRHTVRINAPWLWTLLFGPLYFAAHGVWSHVLISFVCAIVTVGLSWLVYPLFAGGFVRRSYLARGWREIVPVYPSASSPSISESLGSSSSSPLM